MVGGVRLLFDGPGASRGGAMGSQVSPVRSPCMASVTTCKMKSLGQVMMASCSAHLHVSCNPDNHSGAGTMGPHRWVETLRLRYIGYSIKAPRAKGLGQVCDQTHWFGSDGQGPPFTCYSMKRSWNTEGHLDTTDCICRIVTRGYITKHITPVLCYFLPSRLKALQADFHPI